MATLFVFSLPKPMCGRWGHDTNGDNAMKKVTYIEATSGRNKQIPEFLAIDGMCPPSTLPWSVITIHKLIPPENRTLFQYFPELNKIWEIPAHQTEARESYESWGVIEGESSGEIFSIMLGETVIGIIGWFEYGDIPDVLRLRYYGIIPSQRGNHYGERAMMLLLRHLSHAAPSQYVWLSESVSVSRAVAEQITAHFKSMGFTEFSDPYYGSNAGCGKVRSLRIRIPLR